MLFPSRWGNLHSRPLLSFVMLAASTLWIDKEIYWEEFPLEFSPLRRYVKDFTMLSVANLVIGCSTVELSKHQLHNWQKFKLFIASCLIDNYLNYEFKFMTLDVDIKARCVGSCQISQGFLSHLCQVTICINPLNTKRRLLYLKIQSVPRSKHFSSRL